jgi:hypothetical protein
MTAALQFYHESGRHIEVATAAGALLFRYVYAPETPTRESPRPYLHPVLSLAGDVLTNFRPNDHPWHHGLSMTLTNVSGVNFWGGPSYRASDGYQWREDHGAQTHREWTSLQPERLEQTVEWSRAGSGQTLLRERRQIATTLFAGGWTLEWISDLTNVAGRELEFHNYQSGESLAGSHYTGLQFRGARDLLDEHGDATLGVSAEGGLAGETTVHGASTRWIEWSCQHDGSLRRTRIRFENPAAPLAWFVRAKNPIAAFAFQAERSHALAVGATLRLHHRLTFTSV